MSLYQLYPITNRQLSQSGDLLQDIKQLCEAGVKILQLREKKLETRAFYELAQKVRQITKTYQVKLIINDRLDLAQAVKADGVHLGQSDLSCSVARRILGKDKIIGISCPSVEEAMSAEQEGASYVASQAFFPTQTKTVEVKGPRLLQAIQVAVKIPVIAIGGINRNNLEQVLGFGAQNVAMVSGLFNVADVRKNAEWFLEQIQRSRRLHYSAGG